MSSFWNNRISISIFGESHGTSIGVVMDNLPLFLLFEMVGYVFFCFNLYVVLN